MENQIKQLRELAEQYRDFGIKYLFPMGHNELRKQDSINWINDTKLIRVYFADNYRICCVYFGTFETSFWGTNPVQFPYSQTAQTLEELYLDCKCFLESYSSEKVEELQKEIDDKKLKRVAELEAELLTLKQTI